MKMLFAVRNVWLMFFGLGNTLPVSLTWLTIKSVTASCASVSVVTAKLKTTTKGKLMYQHNPTPTELRDAYEVAYGEMGVYFMAGAMYANLHMDIINKL